MRYLIILSLIICSHLLIGQYFPVRQYTTYDGMPSSAIYDIAQDADGLMWFQSGEGPIYYDAKRWYRFPDSLALPKSPNSRLSIDTNRVIWSAGFVQNAFQIKFLEKGLWHTVVLPSDLQLKINRVFAFSHLNDPKTGQIAVGFENRLYVYNSAPDQWKEIEFSENITINNIIADEYSSWIATSGGLYELTGDQLTLIDIHDDQLPNSNIHNIVKYAYDSSYYLLGDTWLAKVKNNSIQLISDKVPTNPTLLRLDKSNLVVDQRGQIFAGSNVPTHFLDTASGQWKKLLIEGLELNINSTKIFCDRENNLWVGDSRGLFKFNLLQFSNFNLNTGLGENEVTAIRELADGTILLANQHYLNTWQQGKITSFLIDPTFAQNFRVLDIYEDKEQERLYLAASFGGLLVYKTGDYSRPLWKISHPNGFVSVQGYDEQIYAATPVDIGVIQDNNFSQIKGKSSYIRNLTVIENQLIISSGLNGIYLYDQQNFTEFRSPRHGFNNVYKPVYYNGHILLSTIEGIGILSGNQIVPWESFPYTIPIYSLINVRDQELWIGSNQGVFKWDGKNLVQYGIPQGLVGNEVNRNAFMEDSQGNIWIGTEKGASLFRGNQSSIPYYLANIEIKQALTGQQNEIKKNTSNTFSFDDNTLSINYQCLSYVREQDIQLRYQLYRTDQPELAIWEEFTQQSSSELRFSNLSPGSYVFKIQAKNQGYDWGKEDQLTWTILPPFYNQWWFIALSALLILGSIVLTFRIRYLYLMRRQEKLEKLIEERTKEVTELNEHLEEKVEARTLLLKEQNEKLREYAFMNAHLLRGPLTKIMSVLLLIKEFPNEPLDENYFTILDSAVSELDEVIYNINQKVADNLKSESIVD